MKSNNPFSLYTRSGSYHPSIYESSAGKPTRLSRYSRRSRKKNHSRTKRFRKFFNKIFL